MYLLLQWLVLSLLVLVLVLQQQLLVLLLLLWVLLPLLLPGRRGRSESKRTLHCCRFGHRYRSQTATRPCN